MGPPSRRRLPPERLLSNIAHAHAARPDPDQPSTGTLGWRHSLHESSSSTVSGRHRPGPRPTFSATLGRCRPESAKICGRNPPKLIELRLNVGRTRRSSTKFGPASTKVEQKLDRYHRYRMDVKFRPGLRRLRPSWVQIALRPPAKLRAAPRDGPNAPQSGPNLAYFGGHPPQFGRPLSGILCPNRANGRPKMGDLGALPAVFGPISYEVWATSTDIGKMLAREPHVSRISAVIDQLWRGVGQLWASPDRGTRCIHPQLNVAQRHSLNGVAPKILRKGVVFVAAQPTTRPPDRPTTRPPDRPTARPIVRPSGRPHD